MSFDIEGGFCPGGQGPHGGLVPLWACFDLISAAVSRFCPFPTRAQNQTEMASSERGPRPFGRVKRTSLGRCGPVLTSSTVVPGTAHRAKGGRRVEGGRSPPLHRIPVRGTGRIQHPVESDLFQKWPRTLRECEKDLKRIQ